MFQKGGNNYKIFIFSAASLFASSNVLAYTNVVPMFLCPNIFCMVVIVYRWQVAGSQRCAELGGTEPTKQPLANK